jgi:hypothetical protein
LKQRADVERISELAVIEDYLSNEMGNVPVDLRSVREWALGKADLTDFERRSVLLSLRAVEITRKYTRKPQ